MFQIAMFMGGTNYTYNMPLIIRDDTLLRMRNGYAEFGLGVNTGIDLPGEVSGFKGVPDNPGYDS